MKGVAKTKGEREKKERWGGKEKKRVVERELRSKSSLFSIPKTMK